MDLFTSAMAVPLTKSAADARREEHLSPLPQSRLANRQPLSCIPLLTEPKGVSGLHHSGNEKGCFVRASKESECCGAWGVGVSFFIFFYYYYSLQAAVRGQVRCS